MKKVYKITEEMYKNMLLTRYFEEKTASFFSIRIVEHASVMSVRRI